MSKIIFFIIGAAFSLLPIFLGDLRLWEIFLMGIPFSALIGFGGAMFFNWGFNRSKVDKVILSLSGAAIASAIGAIVTITAFSLWH